MVIRVTVPLPLLIFTHQSLEQNKRGQLLRKVMRLSSRRHFVPELCPFVSISTRHSVSSFLHVIICQVLESKGINCKRHSTCL